MIRASGTVKDEGAFWVDSSTHSGPVCGVKWNPNYRNILTTCDAGDEKIIRVWDI